MTSREPTGLLALDDVDRNDQTGPERLSDLAWRLAFGAIGWPWLLRSLHGGSRASKRALIRRLGISDDALPHLGSWKADTTLLHRIVDHIEAHRPQVVVELGAGASSLVAARALQLHGGGRLVSFDQHAGFVDATRQWLADNGLSADMRHAPITEKVPNWPGRWYALDTLPERIDLLIIDGPPWTVHPMVRGAAECLFSRLSPGGVVLLDDAARPGERLVARAWTKRWPDMDFRRASDGAKGTLIGRRRKAGEPAANDNRADARPWARAAMLGAALALGWAARDQFHTVTPSAEAAISFVDEAAASHQTSLLRGPMRSQVESPHLDRDEIAHWTGIRLPVIPADWQVRDVQLYPAGASPSVEVALVSPTGEPLSLFASRAETPAGDSPVVARRHDKAIAYWEEGEIAYAVTGAIPPARALALAAELTKS